MAKHLAVIGRVSGDDEDSVLMYEGLTTEEAKVAFVQDLQEGIDNPDAEVYVSYVLTSESPILIEERNV